jgi:hypothetical protein
VGAGAGWRAGVGEGPRAVALPQLPLPAGGLRAAHCRPAAAIPLPAAAAPCRAGPAAGRRGRSRSLRTRTATCCRWCLATRRRCPSRTGSSRRARGRWAWGRLGEADRRFSATPDGPPCLSPRSRSCSSSWTARGSARSACRSWGSGARRSNAGSWAGVAGAGRAGRCRARARGGAPAQCRGAAAGGPAARPVARRAGAALLSGRGARHGKTRGAHPPPITTPAALAPAETRRQRKAGRREREIGRPGSWPHRGMGS